MIREGKNWKKILAGILTSVCVVGSMPIGVFAAEPDVNEDAVVIEETTVYEDTTEDSVETDDEYADIVEDETSMHEEDTEVAEETGTDSVLADNAGDTRTETNPETIVFGKTYEGSLAEEGIKHFYKFTLKEAATFTFNITDDSTQKNFTYITYNISNNLEADNYKDHNKMNWSWRTHDQGNYGAYNYALKSRNTWLKTTDGSDSVKISLLKGDYYVVIYGSFGTTYENPLNYSFSLTDVNYLEKKKSDETILTDKCIFGSNDWKFFTETGYDEYYDDAGPHGPMPKIELNKTYRGILTEDSYVDYYYFTLDSNTPLYLTLESDEWMGEVEASFLIKKIYGTSSYVTDFYFKPHMVASPGNALDGEKLEAIDDYAYKDPNFVKGEYAVYIRGNAFDDNGQKIHRGTTGQYKFMISTGKPTTKPVTSLTLNPQVIPMSVGETKTFTATVAPKDAPDSTVRIEVDNPGIVQVTPVEVSEGGNAVSGVTTYNVKALANGQANIKVTTNGLDKNKKSIEKTCAVSVISNKDCEPIAVKEKIDLRGEGYFNTQEIAKADKFDVTSEDGASGSVSNGIFTAKKPGTVTVVWKKNINKVLVPQAKVTFTLKTPSYKKNTKGKDIKASETVITKRGTVITPADWLLDYDKAETIKPTSFECDAAVKKGLAQIDEKGNVTVLKTGSIKVTALYGEGKNAAKMPFTIKAKVPMLKDAKVKPNAVKPNAKDKTVTLSVTNLPKGITLTADSWKIYKATVDPATNKPSGYTSEIPDSEKIKLIPDEKKSFVKAAVSVAPGTESQYVAVVVTIDGVEYPAFVTIQ